jgi:protein SCO1
MSTPTLPDEPSTASEGRAESAESAERAESEGRAASAESTERDKREPSSIGARFSRLVGNPAAWIVVLLFLFLLPMSRSLAREPPIPPALKLPLPAFELTNQRSEPFSMEKLRGKVWVADFIFLSCPTVCPKLTKRMVEIQHRTRNLGDAFHLVTFTVDPENDTPERLAAYAYANRASPGRWSFLTGSLDAIEGTVVKGFKLAMGKEETSPGLFSIFHGERLVLVDQEGAIRGYYEADDQGMANLMRDIKILVNVR